MRAPSKTQITTTVVVCVLLFLGAYVLWSAYQSSPRAPVLDKEVVYQNKQESFRFLPPDGWQQWGRTEVPPGPLTQERSLVEYRRIHSDQPATLQVSMADIPSTTELKDCIESHSVAKEFWKKVGDAEKFELAGLPAVRTAFEAQIGPSRVMREVVAVRHGERVYFFSGVFPADDKQARAQVRKAVESATW
jgi:hypothetical protein